MNRILGIVLIVGGIIAGAYALSQHEDDKTLVDLGNIEIKKQNPKPSNKTQNYFIIAVIGILGGGFLLSSSRRSK